MKIGLTLGLVKPAPDGDSLPASQYYTDDAETDAYYFDDAETDNYETED